MGGFRNQLIQEQKRIMEIYDDLGDYDLEQYEEED